MQNKVLDGSYDPPTVEPSSDPAALERFYREDAEAFRAAFDEARERHPDDLLLRFWEERLRHDQAAAAKAIPTRDVVLIVLLALVAGTAAKVPDLFSLLGLAEVDQVFYYERHAAFFVLVPLAILFAWWRAVPRRVLAATGAAVVATLLYMNVLPRGESDTVLLATLHVPFLLWGLTGIVFMRGAWRTSSARLRYVTFTGEVLALTGLILIGSVLLTGLTFVLFQVIGLDIETVYTNWVAVYGAAGVPLVAALLVRQSEQLRLAPLIANTFGPLVLLTLVVFLGTMAALQKSPFTDRNFLLVFNVVLLAVLAIAVFSLSEYGRDDTLRLRDYVNVSLLALALVLDAVALSAIVFRLASYGLTPNRLAVLGTNLLVCVHLVWMTWSYVRVLRGRHTRAGVAAEAMRYLPVYLAWIAFVVFIFPLLFGFA